MTPIEFKTYSGCLANDWKETIKVEKKTDQKVGLYKLRLKYSQSEVPREESAKHFLNRNHLFDKHENCINQECLLNKTNREIVSNIKNAIY